MEATDWSTEKAYRLAAAAHAGDTYLDGSPYLEHLQVVADAAVEIAGGLGEGAPDAGVVRQVALLQDVVARAGVDLAELVKEGAPVDVVRSVDACTPIPAESWEEQLSRIEQVPAATVVKVADLRRRCEEQQLALLDEDVEQLSLGGDGRGGRTRAQYLAGLETLEEALRGLS